MKFKVGDYVRLVHMNFAGEAGSVHLVTSINGPWVRVDGMNSGYEATEFEPIDSPNIYKLDHKEETMNTADKLFNSKLTEDEKTLRESGLKDDKGRVTPEGVTAMMDYLYEKHGKELAAQVRSLKEE